MSILSFAQITITGGLARISGLPQLGQPLRLGFYRFRYGTFAGRLGKITSTHQIVYPDQPGATAIEIYVGSGSAGTCQPYYVDSKSATHKQNGYTVNVETNELNAVGFTNGTGESNPRSTQSVTVKTSGPVVVDSTTKTWTLQQVLSDLKSTITLKRLGTIWLPLLSYTCEIASKTVQANEAQNAYTCSPMTGTQYWQPPGGVLNRLDIATGHDPGGSDSFFCTLQNAAPSPVETRMRYLGAVAFEVNGFLEEHIPINSLNQRFLPVGVEPTGVYTWLKPGIVATGTIGYNTYAGTGIQTALGELNMLTNKLQSLIPQ
jgi:hypothetical protein